MPDIIQLPKISATIDGSSYPVTNVDIQAVLGELLEFSVTFTSGDAKDGGVLNISMIRHLAEKVQNMIYKAPKASNVTVEVLGYKGETLSVEGVAVGVNLTATATGGLACTVSAIGNDGLLGQVNYNIWMAYVATQPVLQKVSDHQAKIGKTYVMQMPQSQQEDTSSPLTKRVRQLIMAGIQSYDQLNEYTLNALQDPVLTKQFNEICDFNNEMYLDVVKFLMRSDKYTKFFNNEATINKETAIAIINGIHEMLFESGNNFLDSMFSIAATFKMWYVPKLAEKGKGYIMNQKYGDEKSDGEVSIYCDYVSTSHRGNAYSSPPCKYFTITGNTIETAADKVVRPPTSVVGTFPEKPTRKFGVGYMAGAPGWILHPVVYQKDSKSIPDSTVKKIESTGKCDPNTPRNVTAQEQGSENQRQKNKKDLDSKVSILKYLAKKSYYWTLLQPSTAVISGPFSGRPPCEVGDMVSFGANPGGKIGKGIVTGITITLSPSHSSIRIDLNAVTLGDNKIE